MAIILYSNGIIEDFDAEGVEFTDEELVKTFENYAHLRSFRLDEVPNTWCLWGEMNNPPPNEYNAIGSEIVDADIYSHLIIIHDSELNPNWDMKDTIIYKSYDEFIDEINAHINKMVEIVAEFNKQNAPKDSTAMIFLTPIGQTPKKQVLFSFNPNEQNDNFFKNGNFDIFASKIYEYLTENFTIKDLDADMPFIIFSDNKTMVMVQNEHFDIFIDKLIHVYQKQEQYEICTTINNIKKQWHKYLKNNSEVASISEEKTKKRRGRPPKKT